MVWHCLPTLSGPMPLQMALDELLFESQKDEPQDPVLRFYVSSGPWISTGCSFRSEIDLKKSAMILHNRRVPVCRRITGGGCVLHGEDLIFSLIAPISETGSQRGLESVRSSYKMLHEAVRFGLEAFGLDAAFYSCGGPLPKGSDCFDFPVESDLSWKGRKIAGGAQKRSDGVLLHHESIVMPSGIDCDSMKRAVRKGLEQVFGVSIKSADMDPETYFQAQKLAKDNGLWT